MENAMNIVGIVAIYFIGVILVLLFLKGGNQRKSYIQKEDGTIVDSDEC